MTKQQKTYVLLGAVALVWGLIGFRIYRSVYDKQKPQSEVMVKTPFIPTKLKENKAYTLQASYRDPFLRKLPVAKKKIKRQKKVVKKIEVPFPNIIYNGVVEGIGSKSYTLSINGQQELLKLGDTFQKVKLINANGTQIEVQFDGVIKTIQLQ